MLAVFAGVAIIVWVALLTQDRWSNSRRPLADVAEGLTFSGMVNGDLRFGVNVHDPDVSQPHFVATQCAGLNSNSATIVGQVGASKVVLEIYIPPDADERTSAVWQLPVTGARLFIPGTQDSMGRLMRNLPGQNTDPAGTITVAADRRTGTMDAWFGQNGTGPGEQNVVTHVVGQWRCG